MEGIHKLKGDFIMYEYDKDFWRAIDELTWNQVKRCAKWWSIL